VVKTVIITLTVPFSAVGALWMLHLLGYNMSIALWVGIIALFGIDAETGVFVLLYLDLAFANAKREAGRLTRERLYEAIVEGAAKRLRPKFMTFATMSIGLIPIFWSSGTGSEIMKRIAAPLIGGIGTSFILELVVYPAIYALWRENSLGPAPPGARTQSVARPIFSQSTSSAVASPAALLRLARRLSGGKQCVRCLRRCCTGARRDRGAHFNEAVLKREERHRGRVV
jgi:predicted RND superfamily exporter protein